MKLDPGNFYFVPLHKKPGWQSGYSTLMDPCLRRDEEEGEWYQQIMKKDRAVPDLDESTLTKGGIGGKRIFPSKEAIMQRLKRQLHILLS